ncbi:MFS transporter [Verminephrobacter aporrectodeae subsp. tuberculatae]|uniref:MFS transporter n=1 Tax=Verminephrobacter aporrectodeae subsp. tuberculatae TaxID=1110392 RepID=A0ABT3KZC0_9BURK|nr:MFS transporter [Verminephrobacter aporrectodeae]MCW5323150.1 MFS transporter [Verminephrobacter aporrectodeae subsp. tuberculatae]MCW8165208.1 MFS transporter [Verminephrobacter aporrectodeae subsp. tuberculatae]MCW8167859.1 MFS transporter [Verminephrobacter aporrectodeae subsp. tuberculatae]
MNWALVRLIAGQICLHACMAGMRMAAPLLALRDGYSAASVGVLLALFALVQVFLALPAGRYADRHGLRRPVGHAVVVAVAGASLALLFPGFPALCLAALMTGGATGAVTIALQRHVGRAAHDATQLRQVFSWLAIGPALSNFIGPFCAGLMIDHAGSEAGSTGGYRAAFALMALLPLCTWFWVRDAVELPPVIAAAGGPPRRAWDLMNETPFRRLLIVNWVLSSCWDVHTFVVPLIGHERGLSASVIGSILGGFAIAAATIRVLMPLVAERLREPVVVAGAMLLTTLLFGVYPLLDSAPGMGLCSVLLGFALGSVQPMVVSLLHQITPAHRHGEALGLRLMVINASSVLMPMLFGSAGAVIGAGGLFWLTGAGVGAAVRMAWRLEEKGRG